MNAGVLMANRLRVSLLAVLVLGVAACTASPAPVDRHAASTSWGSYNHEFEVCTTTNAQDPSLMFHLDQLLTADHACASTFDGELAKLTVPDDTRQDLQTLRDDLHQFIGNTDAAHALVFMGDQLSTDARKVTADLTGQSSSSP
jgi:hypothetical protein